MPTMKPSTIAMWVFIVGVSGALTWFAFIKFNIDPYNLGIASLVSGYAALTLADGTTSTYQFVSCVKPNSYSVEFSGPDSKLTMGLPDTSPYPNLNSVSWSFVSPDSPMGTSLDCAAPEYYVVQSNDSSTGRNRFSISTNISGTIDIVCPPLMGNKINHHFHVKFQNCR